MPINLLSAGGGTTTITTASSASNFTVTIPAATGSVITTAPGTSGNVLSSNGTSWVSSAPPSPAALSTASGSAPSYSARAWINFNGLGTPAIRASGNVSSLVDNGVGDYTVNFTTAMSDVNYASTLGLDPTGGVQIATSLVYVKARATTNVRLQSWYGTGGAAHDIQEIDCAVFR